MTAATVNGTTIEYEVEGPEDGQPLLLVMGLGAQLVVWPQPFVDRMVEEGFRVIRFDNRDVGRSARFDAPPPTVGQLALTLVSKRLAKAPYTLRHMADDASALLDHLGIDRAHVVGASMGGMIAQELAIGHPEQVATLTSIMSTTGNRRVGGIAPRLLPALLKSRKAPEGTVEAALEIGRLIAGPHFDEQGARDLYAVTTERAGDPAAAQAGLARQTMAVLAARDRTADLTRLQVPTLVVHGLLDPLVRPSGGMATARAVPESRLVMYPDMAHDVPHTRVQELAGEIVDTCSRAPIGRTVAAS